MDKTVFYDVEEVLFYKLPIVAQYYKEDGIHLNPKGNEMILDKCFIEYYKNKL